MKRRYARIFHRTSSLIVGLGLFVLTATGLVLLHPEWFGPMEVPSTVLAADPTVAGRLLRAGPYLLEESLDGGDKWQDLPLHMVPSMPIAFRFAPDNPSKVWLLGKQELLVSVDGGKIWEPVMLPDKISFDEPACDLAISAGGVPIITSPQSAWRLEDRTWRELWHVQPSRAKQAQVLLQRFHAGHWGPSWIARVHDVVAVISLLVIGSGVILFTRRNGLNGNDIKGGRTKRSTP